MQTLPCIGLQMLSMHNCFYKCMQYGVCLHIHALIVCKMQEISVQANYQFLAQGAVDAQ